MGMEQTVSVSAPPSWDTIRSLLAERGFPVQLRMIDGQLAFPEETPPESWTELRVGTPQGMITLARRPGQIAVITWGNADEAMRQAWNALTWACAAASGGNIATAHGDMTAESYLKQHELPGAFNTSRKR